jgi:hypothetical protein
MPKQGVRLRPVERHIGVMRRNAGRALHAAWIAHSTNDVVRACEQKPPASRLRACARARGSDAAMNGRPPVCALARVAPVCAVMQPLEDVLALQPLMNNSRAQAGSPVRWPAALPHAPWCPTRTDTCTRTHARTCCAGRFLVGSHPAAARLRPGGPHQPRPPLPSAAVPQVFTLRAQGGRWALGPGYMDRMLLLAKA